MEISGITWILSYRCNLRCEHCFFDVAGPPAVLAPDVARAALASLKGSAPLQWQHVSGGEPLLFEAQLYELLEVIRDFGTPHVGIASNGFWGESPARARQVVANLKSRGVNGVCLSADAYHQELLPLGPVLAAAEQVARQGLARHSFIVSTHTEASSAPLHDVELPLPLARVPVRKIGKGASSPGAGAEPPSVAIPDQPCRDLCCCLGETSPFAPKMVWIDPYGKVLICYGIVIGDLQQKPLAEILADYSVENSLLLKTLAEQGPVGLYRLAVAEGWRPEVAFSDECDLCWHARAFLREFWPAELAPDECYPARRF